MVHGRTKEELLAITDHFNLQVENPLNVLDQETAKSFLNSTSSGDKYHVLLSSFLKFQGHMIDDNQSGSCEVRSWVN